MLGARSTWKTRIIIQRKQRTSLRIILVVLFLHLHLHLHLRIHFKVPEKEKHKKRRTHSSTRLKYHNKHGKTKKIRTTIRRRRLKQNKTKNHFCLPFLLLQKFRSFFCYSKKTMKRRRKHGKYVCCDAATKTENGRVVGNDFFSKKVRWTTEQIGRNVQSVGSKSTLFWQFGDFSASDTPPKRNT